MHFTITQAMKTGLQFVHIHDNTCYFLCMCVSLMRVNWCLNETLIIISLSDVEYLFMYLFFRQSLF